MRALVASPCHETQSRCLLHRGPIYSLVIVSAVNKNAPAAFHSFTGFDSQSHRTLARRFAVFRHGIRLVVAVRSECLHLPMKSLRRPVRSDRPSGREYVAASSLFVSGIVQGQVQFSQSPAPREGYQVVPTQRNQRTSNSYWLCFATSMCHRCSPATLPPFLDGEWTGPCLLSLPTTCRNWAVP